MYQEFIKNIFIICKNSFEIISCVDFYRTQKAIIIYAVGGTFLLVFIGLTIYCCRRKSTSTNTSQASIVARRSTKNSSSDRVVLETGHNAISDADVWNPKVPSMTETVGKKIQP